MPTFFHGDHASTFVAGSYLRGIRNFDVRAAYRLLLNNAFVEGKGGRPHIKEYMERGWISEMDTKEPKLETVAKAAVAKTQEYAYDDYATALLAKELGDRIRKYHEHLCFWILTQKEPEVNDPALFVILFQVIFSPESNRDLYTCSSW